MKYTHSEFKIMTNNDDWIIGILNFSQAARISSNWYLKFKFYIGYSILICIIFAYSIGASSKFGFGCLIGIPFGVWMAYVGRPNINLFDVVWIVFSGFLVSLVASLISWNYNFSMLGMGFVSFVISGIIKYDALGEIKNECINKPEFYFHLKELNNLMLLRIR